MNYLKKIIKKLYRMIIVVRVRIISKQLANALRYFFEYNPTPEEKVWIHKIESLRKQLKSSSTEITVVDYGAGSPDLKRTEEDMHQGNVITTTVGDSVRSCKSYYWSYLLLRLIREFRPSVCLELGTCLGISTLYQATALKLNQWGKIITLEGAESLALLAKEHFKMFVFDNVTVVIGRFQDTLDEVLQDNNPINFVFIDGHHDEKATLAYFEKISPFLSKRAILIFDDINWSSGMKKAWRVIEKDGRVKISVDLYNVGICIVDSKMEKKKSFKVPLMFLP